MSRDGIRSRYRLHSRSVDEEDGNASLSDERIVDGFVAHALLEQGQLACFAHEQPTPLHNDNGEENGSLDTLFGIGTIAVILYWTDSPSSAIVARIIEIIDTINQ